MVRPPFWGPKSCYPRRFMTFWGTLGAVAKELCAVAKELCAVAKENYEQWPKRTMSSGERELWAVAKENYMSSGQRELYEQRPKGELGAAAKEN